MSYGCCMPASSAPASCVQAARHLSHAVMCAVHGDQAPGAAAVSQQPGRRGTWHLNTLSCSCSRRSSRGRGAARRQIRAAGRRCWHACVVAQWAQLASQHGSPEAAIHSTHLFETACGGSAAARLMARGSCSALPLMLAEGVSASAAGRRRQTEWVQCVKSRQLA